MPFVKRTRAIFRTAEFGLRGVVVVTFVQTPRLKGDGKNLGRFFFVLKAIPSAGVLSFDTDFFLLFFTSWFIVDMFKQKSPLGATLILYYKRDRDARAVCKIHLIFNLWQKTKTVILRAKNILTTLYH